MKRKSKRSFEQILCETCCEPVTVNFKHIRLCLDAEQANAVLCADNYDQNEAKYGNSDIPAKLPNMCYAASEKRLRVNFAKALNILQQWKTHNVPVRAEKYLFWNHTAISEYLATHHGVHVRDPRNACKSTQETGVVAVQNDSTYNEGDGWVTSDESETDDSNESTSSSASSDENEQTDQYSISGHPPSPPPLNLQNWLEDPSKGQYDILTLRKTLERTSLSFVCTFHRWGFLLF